MVHLASLSGLMPRLGVRWRRRSKWREERQSPWNVAAVKGGAGRKGSVGGTALPRERKGDRAPPLRHVGSVRLRLRASWEGNRYRKERGRREARLFLRMVIGGSKNKLPQTGQDRRQHREDKIKYLDFFLRTKQKV